MMLNRHKGYPAAMLCTLLDLPRSSYYYQRIEPAEPELEKAMKEIAGKFPTYGSRWISHQLRRMPYGMRVNRKSAANDAPSGADPAPKGPETTHNR